MRGGDYATATHRDQCADEYTIGDTVADSNSNTDINSYANRYADGYTITNRYAN